MATFQHSLTDEEMAAMEAELEAEMADMENDLEAEEIGRAHV